MFTLCVFAQWQPAGDKIKTIDLKTKNVSVKEFTPYVTSDMEGDNLALQPKLKYGSKISIPKGLWLL